MAETGAGMYRDNILDHYKHPHNKGAMEGADVRHKENNPLCGDEIEVFLKVSENEEKAGEKDGERHEKENRAEGKAGKAVITDVRFEGQGCAISTAAASMLTGFVKGKKLEDVAKMDKADVFKLLGVPVSPARVKCALLALKAVKMAALEYFGEKTGGETKP